MPTRRSRAAAIGGAVLVASLAVPTARAQMLPEPTIGLPVLAEELGQGTGARQVLDPGTPTVKVVDGDPGDWVGVPSGFAGTGLYDAGEYVYQDHLFDAWGADDGRDAERLATLDPLRDAEPRTYRIEPLIGQDPPSQLGFDSPGPVKGEEHYGDAGLVDVADLVEVRVGTEGSDLLFLARTTTMHSGADTAVLLLFDTAEGDDVHAVPFGSGLTTRAERAVLLAGDAGWTADLEAGTTVPLPSGSVATDPSGWTNAIEARLDGEDLGVGGSDLRVAVATGRFDGDGGFAPLAGPGGSPLTSHVANVAFREAERVRTFFDRGQALALHAGSIDEFTTTVDLDRLRNGDRETLEPRSGYHERVFRSSEAISDERQMDGVWQHYGLYLPDGYDPQQQFPLQWWLHWRGGHAHSAASVIPRMFRTLGDGETASAATGGIADSIVVAPRGRGTSTWYVGIGHADVLEVWDDVFALLGERIDAQRVYVTGHSMGGWGSYLLPILYPDRFAAAFPYSGPVTQGAWTGLDFTGCDGFQWEEYTPCYIEANGSDPRAQHTRRLLENLYQVPVAIFHGAADELVPTSGVTRQAEAFALLGQRHRTYMFPGYEHFSFPIADEWVEGGRYAHRFASPQHPARVRYVRDTAFEQATETVQSRGRDFDFAFDSAYWMRGLQVAPGAAAARFDGRTRAVVDDHVAIPEAGGPAAPGQSGPYAMAGLAWLASPLPGTPSNGFDVNLSGAASVELDLAGMLLDPDSAIDGAVTSDRPLTLRLDGGFGALPTVTCACLAPPTLEAGVLTLTLPAGTTNVAIDA